MWGLFLSRDFFSYCYGVWYLWRDPGTSSESIQCRNQAKGSQAEQLLGNSRTDPFFDLGHDAGLLLVSFLFARVQTDK